MTVLQSCVTIKVYHKRHTYANGVQMPANPLLALTQMMDDDTDLDHSEMNIESLITPNPLIGAGGLIESLNANQEQFLVGKLYGLSDKQAAEASSISPATAYSWKQQNKDFRIVYEKVTTQPVIMAAEVTAFGLAKAIHKLVLMLDHTNVRVVQYAIDRLIDLGGVNKSRVEVTHKSGNTGDLDDILERLEERRAESEGTAGGDSQV